MITKVGLKFMMTSVPYLQYLLNNAQIDYVFYLVIGFASMCATAKIIQTLFQVPQVRKTVRSAVSSKLNRINKVTQAVEIWLWKLLLTPFHHGNRRKRGRSRARYSHNYREHRRKIKVKLPRLWLDEQKIELKRNGPRSHFLFHLAQRAMQKLSVWMGYQGVLQRAKEN